MKVNLSLYVTQLASAVLAMGSAQAADAPRAAPDAGPSIKFEGFLLDFAETNPSTGVHKGAWGNTALLQFGADLNLQRLAGWQGATIHARDTLFLLKHNARLNPGSNPPETLQGHFWAQDVGSTLGGAPFPNNIPSSTLSVLTLEQNIGTALNFELGRMNFGTAFDQAMNCENILSCQNPVTIYDNPTAPIAFATWGARARYSPDAHNHLQFGIYEDNFAHTRTKGFNFSTKGRSGSFVVGEYGYQSSFENGPYPTSVTVGIWHDTSKATDPASGADQSGTNGAYMRASQVTWRNDGGSATGRPVAYLQSFATLGYSPSRTQSYRTYAELGSNIHGLFASRPMDHYGVKLAYLRVNDNQLDLEQGFREHFSGIDYRSPNNQYRAELNARIGIKPGIFVEPVVEYIKNPNVQFLNPLGAVDAPKSGFIFGLTLFVALPALF